MSEAERVLRKHPSPSLRDGFSGAAVVTAFRAGDDIIDEQDDLTPWSVVHHHLAADTVKLGFPEGDGLAGYSHIVSPTSVNGDHVLISWAPSRGPGTSGERSRVLTAQDRSIRAW